MKSRMSLILVTCLLLFVFCKKDPLIKLDNERKELTLIPEVLEVDSICLTAIFSSDTLLDFNVVNDSAYFKIIDELNQTMILEAEVTFTNDSTTLELNSQLSEAGVATTYEIQAFALLRHKDFDSFKRIKSQEKTVNTDSIYLETSINIKRDRIKLKTDVYVASNGQRNRQAVNFSAYGHIINNEIRGGVELGNNKIDTFIASLPSQDFDFPIDYRPYAVFHGDSIPTTLLTLSLDSCVTFTQGVAVDFRLDTPRLTVVTPIINCGENFELRSSVPVETFNETVTYEWYIDDEIRSFAISNEPELIKKMDLSSGNHRFYVKVVDGTCPSAASDTMTLTVRNLPTPTMNFVDDFCDNEMISFEINNDYSPEAVVEWFREGILIEQERNFVLNIMPNAENLNKTFKAVVKFAGCTSDTSNSEIARIENTPNLGITIPDTTICSGEMLIIDLSNDPIDNTVIYDWLAKTSDNTLINFPSTNRLNFNLPQIDIYSFEVTVRKRDNPTCRTSQNFTVSVKEKPVVMLPLTIPICDSSGDTLMGGGINITCTNCEEYKYRYSIDGGAFGGFSFVNDGEDAEIVFTSYPDEQQEKFTYNIQIDNGGCKVDSTKFLEYIPCPE